MRCQCGIDEKEELFSSVGCFGSGQGASFLRKMRDIPRSVILARRRPLQSQHIPSHGSSVTKRLQTSMVSKRRSTTPPPLSLASKKRHTGTTAGMPSMPSLSQSDSTSIGQTNFYPAEMSDERCKRYIDNKLPTPLKVLEKTLRDSAAARNGTAPGESVIHWFKRDLRLQDNASLSRASQLARERDVPLICVFIVSPQDYLAHRTSAVRVDFELRTLAVLKEDLAKLEIPLYITTINDRGAVLGHLIEKCKEWKARDIFCNIE